MNPNGSYEECSIDITDSLPCMSINAKKRRGRPCATERRNNELIQEKFTNLIRSANCHSDELTRNKLMPFIVKRQRRSRANDRERGRMDQLNVALGKLKEHLPIELFQNKISSSEDNHDDTSSSGSLTSKSKTSKSYSKITKIDTLRTASEYILLLTNLLKDSTGTNEQYGTVFSDSQSPMSVDLSPVYQKSLFLGNNNGCSTKNVFNVGGACENSTIRVNNQVTQFGSTSYFPSCFYANNGSSNQNGYQQNNFNTQSNCTANFYNDSSFYNTYRNNLYNY